MRRATLLVACLLLLALAVRADEGCMPGTLQRTACKTCICFSTGRWICTKSRCKDEKREIFCTPGTTFKLGCKVCRCRADGKTAGCTSRPCD